MVIMLTAMCEMVNKGRVCLVNWTPQSFVRGGETRSGWTDLTAIRTDSSSRNEDYEACHEVTDGRL